MTVPTITQCGSIEDALEALGIAATTHYQDKESSEIEKAFYLGIMNVCASFANAAKVENVGKHCHISLDYEDVKTEFEAAAAEAANTHKTCTCGGNCGDCKCHEEQSKQLTLEELYPELFAAIDEKITKALNKTAKE